MERFYIELQKEINRIKYELTMLRSEYETSQSNGVMDQLFLSNKIALVVAQEEILIKFRDKMYGVMREDDNK